MARRRRLNKKVALLGTTVFLLLTLAAVMVILHLTRDPAAYIAEGDAAWAAQDYKTAIDSYRQAYGLIDSAPEKIDLLFKLADAYKQTDQWDKVLGCWNAITTSDPRNVKARLGQLKYGYILADGLGSAGRSASGYWEEVLSQARKTMEVIDKAGLGNEERSQWEPAFGTAESRAWSGGSARLGPHVHFVKGRAAFELAAMGAVAAPDELLQEAQSDLQEGRRLDPSNPQVYRYLAEVSIREGEAAASRGNLDQKNRAEQQADEILAEGVRAAGDRPETHINVLMRRLTVAQRDGIPAARERMKVMEAQFEGLTQRFASSPQVFAALGQFHSFYAAYLDQASGMEKLNRAIQANEQARTRDPGNVEYSLLTASYHYRMFSVYGDVAALNRAVELTEKGLELSGAQNRSGPMQFANRVNRLALCSLLGKCCVERLLALPPSDPTRDGLVARVEKAVHEIRQIRGTGEDPEVVKWQGMLDLARGQAGQAVRSLYAAYEQIKAANPPEQRDPFLSWTLAKLFERTSEMGAVIDFLGTALSSGIVYTRPDTLLDYGDVLLRAGSYDPVLNIAGVFEERFGGNNRSQALRIKALIAKGQAAQAEQEIAKLQPDDPNTVVLHLHLARARSNQSLTAIRRQELSDGQATPNAVRTMTEELRGQQRREAELVQQLLQVHPEAIQDGHLAELCESLIIQGDADAARTIVDAFLTRFGDNVTALFYRGLLSEPDPRNCPPGRRRELQEQAARALADPVHRSLNLGLLYEQTQQPDRAVSALRSVLDATAPQGRQDQPAYVAVRPSSPRQVAVGHLFDLACRQENWPLASEMAEIARREDLDDCAGLLFAARLAVARKEYESALERFNECLTQRPVFSYGYMLRSDVKAALGKEHESIEDARRASSLNPVDPLVAKGLAKALYARNRRLGATLSSEQRQETRQALEQAIRLDPRDPGLLSVYVDILGDSDPEKAVALRQTIQANTPSVDNALKLGRLAAQIALNAQDPAQQQAFFTMARTAFEQARKLEPTNRVVLEATMLMEALVAVGQNRYAEAIEYIDKGIQSAGPDTDAGLDYTARKAQLLTLAYNRTSDKTYLHKAIAVYESLRVKWPKNSSVLNNLAYLLAQNDERLAEALEYARTAVEQNPDEANYLDTYGYLLYKNGKYAEAARSLMAAVQKYEGDRDPNRDGSRLGPEPKRDEARLGTQVRGMVPTDVYEHLGMVHEAMGDRGQALDAYRRALEAGGTALSEAAKQRINTAIRRLQ